MAAKKIVRSTTRQIELLVDYMSTHTRFANGEFSGPQGRQAHDEEWVRLQTILHEYGPTKTVEQWRTTWRDLKKKARADGARTNAARVITGNNTVIPTLSQTSQRILNIIGTESAYGMAGQCETVLGEIIVPPPLAISPPPATYQSIPPPVPPAISPPPAFASTPPLPPPTSPPDTPQASTSSTQQNARRGCARNLQNDFLASDAQTRNVLVDIKNSLLKKNDLATKKLALSERKIALAERNIALAERNTALAERNTALAERAMRHRHIQRLQKTRFEKHSHMGSKD